MGIVLLNEDILFARSLEFTVFFNALDPVLGARQYGGDSKLIGVANSLRHGICSIPSDTSGVDRHAASAVAWTVIHCRLGGVREQQPIFDPVDLLGDGAVVVGGLAVSTVITLILTPLVFTLAIEIVQKLKSIFGMADETDIVETESIA